MKWFNGFWNSHGERVMFGGMALVFAIFFVYSGNQDMQGGGRTILIGLAMVCFNKARGGAVKDDKPPKE